jgi:hypothetical protein
MPDSTAASIPGFAQQMQGWVGRAVRAVLDGIGGRIGETIIRMEARDLQFAIDCQVPNRCVRDIEEIVEVEEVAENMRVNQQGGLTGQRIGCMQGSQFSPQVVEQGLRIACRADHETDALLDERRARERAQIETDHSAFDPAACRSDDGRIRRGVLAWTRPSSVGWMLAHCGQIRTTRTLRPLILPARSRASALSASWRRIAT